MKLLLRLTPLLLVLSCTRPPAVLESSSPASEERLEEAPGKVALTFNQSMQLDSASIEILHRDTTAYLQLPVARAANSDILEGPLPHKLLGGHYLVRWRAMSRDGRVLTGLYPFVVGTIE